MESTMTIGKKMFLAFMLVIVATAVLPGALSYFVSDLVPQEYIFILTGFLGILVGMIAAFVMARRLTTEIRTLATTARVVA
ncbi:MAG: hypothetical protein WC713_07415, partial [Candidatus Methylomirabilota bacterium]